MAKEKRSGEDKRIDKGRLLRSRTEDPAVSEQKRQAESSRYEERKRRSATSGRRFARRSDDDLSLSRDDRRRLRRQQAFRMRIITVAAVLLLILVWYLVVAAGYKKKFLPNTTINGYDVSKMSVADAEDILRKSVENYQLEVAFRGGKNEMIRSTDVDLTYVSSNEVERIMENQGRLKWIASTFGKAHSYFVETSFRFDTDKLKTVLAAFPEFQSGNYIEPESAKVIMNPNLTFKVASEIEGRQPDETVVYNAVDNAINASSARLNLDSVEGAYKTPAVRSDSTDLAALSDELNAFVSTPVTVVGKDGTQTVINRAMLAEWVSYDEGSKTYSLDADSIYNKCWAIIGEYMERDNDVHTVMKFKPTNYAEVTLPCAHYGYEIDQESSTDRLYEAVRKKTEKTVELKSSVDLTRDSSLGGTYIEVDVTKQHVYYYENGKLALDMECVTGKEAAYNRRTPSGIYSILNKMEDQTLGSLNSSNAEQRYESFVDYWMPFFESYGLHDATWRGEGYFGGSWYIEYGSHGCVNLPPEQAKELYEMIDYYTPVVVCREGDQAPEGTQRGDTYWNAPADAYYEQAEDDTDTDY